MLLKRGLFSGALVAGALFGATDTVVPPPSYDMSYSPVATRRPYANVTSERVRRQNALILALAVACVTNELIE